MPKVKIDIVSRLTSLLVLRHNLEGASVFLAVSSHVDRVIFAEVYLPESPTCCSFCRSNVREMLKKYNGQIEIAINIHLNL